MIFQKQMWTGHFKVSCSINFSIFLLRDASKDLTILMDVNRSLEGFGCCFHFIEGALVVLVFAILAVVFNGVVVFPPLEVM